MVTYSEVVKVKMYAPEEDIT